MNKQKIIDQLKENVQLELGKAKNAFEKTKSFAAEEDMRAESKWDTRSTEAKFLASAQLQRVEELKQELQLLDDIDLTIAKSSQSVSIGSVVEIEYNGRVRYYFISPTAGGTQLSIDGKAILVISVFSPLGSEVINLCEGDNFEVETPNETRGYSIKKIH